MPTENPRTKEQIIADEKQKLEVSRRRAIVKDKLFPLLLEKSKSVEDAKHFCNATSLAIKQAFNNQLKDMLVEKLQMAKFLDPKGDVDEIARFTRMFSIFDKETILVAVELLEGMIHEIDGTIQMENKYKALKDLKIKLYEPEEGMKK